MKKTLIVAKFVGQVVWIFTGAFLDSVRNACLFFIGPVGWYIIYKRNQ